MAIGMVLCSLQLLLIALGKPDFLLWAGWQTFVAVGVVAYCPTLIQPYCQRKLFKIVARALLGGSIVLLWFGAMVLIPETVVGIFLRSAFIVAFFVVMKLTLSFRSWLSTRSRLQCPDGGFPFCQFGTDRDFLNDLPSGSPSKALLTELIRANLPYEIVGRHAYFADKQVTAGDPED